MIEFRAPQQAIDLAVEKLKNDRIVHPDAVFNPSAPQGLRREIAYYDRDFMYRLGRTSAEERIVDSALEMLKNNDLVPASSRYDKNVFEKHRRVVREKFVGSWTSLSPTMERLMYMLTSVHRPMHLLELGSFWGYTLAWFAGPCVGPYRVYQAKRIIGIDIDTGMTDQARTNFTKLGCSDDVQLLAEDARLALGHIPGPIDFVYIEAKSDKKDGLYLQLLKQVYDLLNPGAWVIAHDNMDWTFTAEMDIYLPYVRDPNHFVQSISFQIDECGLELSVK